MNKAKFEALLIEAENVRKGMIDYLYESRGEFVLVDVGSHYVTYELGDWYIKVWTANGEVNARFYETLGGIKLDSNECYTEEMRENLWNMTREAICQNGEKRRIEKTQMQNDLYFRFKGVHNDVKFTGYDDSDWWNKYKPTEVKEDESITWSIDWNKMEAIYKPTTK